MTIKLKTFSFSHLKLLDVRPEQGQALGVLTSDYGRLLENASTVKISAFYKGACIACWGLVPLWAGVSEAWMLVSPNLSRGSLSVCRNIMQILDASLEHRIQTSVLCDFEQGHRFVKMLGFRAEGVMEDFDNVQRSHIRYARLKKWQN